jgi:hypothetical protein
MSLVSFLTFVAFGGVDPDYLAAAVPGAIAGLLSGVIFCGLAGIPFRHEAAAQPRPSEIKANQSRPR